MKKSQSGFAPVLLLLVALVIGVAGFVILRAASSKQPNRAKEAPSMGLIWQQAASGWQSTQEPPKCPEQPMLKAPTDVAKATSVLYPGQPRGGNYKPHGGFRFDTTKDNIITVTAPIDGYQSRGTG